MLISPQFSLSLGPFSSVKLVYLPCLLDIRIKILFCWSPSSPCLYISPTCDRRTDPQQFFFFCCAFVSFFPHWRIMDYTSPTAPLMRTSPAPLPNQWPASRHPEVLPEPTADGEPEPAVTREQRKNPSLSLKNVLTKCVSRQHRLFLREF